MMLNKIFGNKLYHFSELFTSKTEAKEYVQELRNEGQLARTIPDGKYQLVYNFNRVWRI